MKHGQEIIKDITIVLLSVVVAGVLVKTGVISDFLRYSEKLEFLGSFIAGMFFTSIFTTAPAIVTLGEIARENSILPTALFGAIGAVVGDLIIFRFVRDRLSEHIVELVKHQGSGKRIKALFRLRFFRWFTFLLGGLIIASPFPDELGISLLGFSKMRLLWFIPLSWVANFIGILIISLVAKTL